MTVRLPRAVLLPIAMPSQLPPRDQEKYADGWYYVEEGEEVSIASVRGFVEIL